MAKRKKNWKGLYIGLTACFSFCMHLCFSQTVETITDRKDILIGEQIKLTIKANLPLQSSFVINWFTIPDSIPHFDIVDPGKTDTVDYKDNSKHIEQTIIITSFDSGSWVFPALLIKFATEAVQPVQSFQTDSFFVNVGYSPSDSTNQLRDIKPIIKVSVTDYLWLYITGGIILLLLVIILLYRYWKKKRKLKSGEPLSRLSAYDEAITELNKLGQYNLDVAEELKLYHSKLAEIFKRYAGRKQQLNLLNKTTGDILISMSDNNMSTNSISKLATALRCTDAVKFAKYQPSADESDDCLQKIKETINLMEASKLLNTKPLN